jgi:uncharacterized protein (DUF1800 family)
MRNLALSIALVSALAGCATSPPRTALAGNPAQDTLWLDRLTWAASSTDLAQVRANGRAAWLDRQLQPAAPAALPDAARSQIQALGVTQQELLPLVQSLEAQRKAADALTDDTAKAAAQKDYQQALTKLARDASARALLNALYSPNQLQEQMTWFWFNHFNVH